MIEFMNALCRRNVLGLDMRAHTGCWERAHRIALLIEKQGWIAGKLWAIAPSRLVRDGRMIQPDLSQSSVPMWRDTVQNWHVHVASTAVVRTDQAHEGRPVSEIMILDPTMFNRPTRAEVWFAHLRENSARIAYTGAECFRLHTAYQNGQNLIIDYWELDEYHHDTERFLGRLLD